LKKLRRELEQNKAGSERLFEAVEKGQLPMDDLLSKRAHATQARRQAILLEIASLERQQQLPQKLFSTLNVQALWQALKSKVVMRRRLQCPGACAGKTKAGHINESAQLRV